MSERNWDTFIELLDRIVSLPGMTWQGKRDEVNPPGDGGGDEAEGYGSRSAGGPHVRDGT
jgi:hypothetical protein